MVVARLKAVSGNKKSFVTTATVDCAIQELDREARTQLDMVQDRGWQSYFDIEDEAKIKEGDMITDDDGKRYKVLEVTIKDYGINQHLDVILIDHEDD